MEPLSELKDSPVFDMEGFILIHIWFRKGRRAWRLDDVNKRGKQIIYGWCNGTTLFYYYYYSTCCKKCSFFGVILFWLITFAIENVLPYLTVADLI